MSVGEHALKVCKLCLSLVLRCDESLVVASKLGRYAGRKLVLCVQCVSAAPEARLGRFCDRTRSHVRSLAEIDEPGEYTVNRSSGMLYLWPPSGPMATAIADYRSGAAADTIVGAVSQIEEPVVNIRNTSNVSLGGLSIYFGRGPGVVVSASSDVIVSDSDIRAVGLMGVNISESSRVLVTNVTIDDAGNGGVYMYSGDRTTLTPGLAQVCHVCAAGIVYCTFFHSAAVCRRSH